MTPWKLSDVELNHWTYDNQRASMIAYLKYRPLFLLRPKFYKAFYNTYIKEFAEKLFSIKDYEYSHNLITIFGIKIKFPKRKFAKLRKENPYYEYVKNNIDITTIPPATGQIRDIQLANLALLKEFDYVCKQNGLKYWLDFGSLLGAVRHKGFIPWDDDIDVSMMREDYEKILDAFNETSKNADMYAEQTYLGKAQTIIKIKHRKCPHLFVDIFPHDWANSKLDRECRIQKTNYLHDIRQKMCKNKNLNTISAIINYVKSLNKETIPDIYVKHSDIQCGMEYSYTEPIWIHSYETIFPLKEIEFEGFNAMGVNKPDEYLTDIMGDYMSYPKKIGFGHTAYIKLSETEKEIMKDLIGGLR